MANTKSAKKRVLVAERNKQRNRAVRSALRTTVRKFREALDAGNLDVATGLLPKTHAEIDRCAKKGIVHDRTASRTKSRLALAHGRLAKAKQG